MTEETGPYPPRKRKSRASARPCSGRRERAAKPPRPLDNAVLEELALGYVARFATSAKGLERYCRRKLREREWVEGEPAPDIAALVDRFVAKGYVNDAEYARARQGSLLRRGYGERRVSAALDAAGIGEDARSTIGEAQARHAALRLAQKRRLGPFGADGAPPADRALREKQFAAMMRAGHSLDSARELVNAASVDEAEEWAHALDPDHDDDRPGGFGLGGPGLE